MRLQTVVAVIVVILLTLAMSAQGFNFPGKGFFSPGSTRPGPFTGSTRPGPFSGFSGLSPFSLPISVDFLSRGDLVPGRLISTFPEVWRPGASNATVTADYLGFKYAPAGPAQPPVSGLYFAGEQHGGKKIYVLAAGKRPVGVPGIIYLRNGSSYEPYAIVNKPPVYAYVPFGAYNANESVTFGLVNERGGRIELRNAAPFEIQRKEGAAWKSVFTPFAAQVIVPVENGSSKEWTWDQRQNDGSLAGFGEYRALIDGKYAAGFRVTPEAPAVERSAADYDQPGLLRLSQAPELAAFGRAHASAPTGQREDTVSFMQHKAWARGLDPDRLRAALDAAVSWPNALPCLAIHAKYEGSPAWIIVYCWGTKGGPLSRVSVYAADDASGTVTLCASCP